ncbi:MAG: hypothetical protein AMJ54_01315 [Deltaproteobacteria bacterium SG8_13]|nr:MAG: hypothetical protein AMJ54_01315 [Deltaproteobacteria bacterium SG8_13]
MEKIAPNNPDEIIVIGGGVIGLACAHYLSVDGKPVRVIERETVGSGASHGNCGLIFISHLLPLCAPGVIRHELIRIFRRGSPLYVKPSPNLFRLAWLLRFAAKCNPQHLEHAVRARASILQYSDALYQELFEPEGIDGEHERKGVLLVFRSGSDMERYGQTLAGLERFGIEAKAFRGAALTDLEPSLRGDLYGGWHHSHDSHLRPDAFIREWKNLLVRNGVQFEENCIFQRFVSSRPESVTLQTDRGVFTADACVIAAGAWSPQLIRGLAVRLPMQPGKGYSITFANSLGCPKIPCIFEERSVVATPFRNGCRLGGTMEFSGHGTHLVKKRLENLRKAAGEYLRDPPAEPVAEQWAGLRPIMFDDLPVIDRVPDRPNLYVATGHGMMGVSLAPATGRIIADLVAGRDPQIDISPFGLQRFR